ncbi:hypothetical protein ACQ45_gp83 [Citrobacter phage Stevie]|uniref:Uncharacterized protein n=1 Tax=Citrobacter phage Stevie TaxID=2885922 RepID=A0A0A0YRF4_9CAUD|nr:hypothetical protein ACQ45_gp83 [Citrobacter phage Stevie]AIX12352.1 hypothetical protein CPT_Stevie83 [Citrobacter phage Stevie]
MITINLSEEQAKSLLRGLGWRMGSGSEAVVNIKDEVAKELFAQLEHKLMPASTSAAELAVWRHEQGLNEMDIEKWKRKNESLGSAFSSYIDSVANQVMEK